VTDATSPDDAARLRQLAVALHDLSRAVRQEQGDQAGGLPRLPPTADAVMRYVDQHPGTSVGGAAAALGLRQSNVSAAVRGLAGRGLVERVADAADRRVARLHPTARARSRRGTVEDAWAQTLGSALARLDPADAAAVRAAAGPLARLAGQTRAPAAREDDGGAGPAAGAVR
jgi:DNA-binding MarR family transcriptional regulator